MDDPPLASLSLTHVHYNPDDRLSLLAAWLSLSPQALCVIYVSLIWSTREAEVLLMFGGQMACEAFNWLLKRYIKEERPRRTCERIPHPSRTSPDSPANRLAVARRRSTRSKLTPATVEMNGKGYGMPSSHAQFVAFFSVSLSLFMLVRHKPHSTTHSPTTFRQRLVLSVAALATASAVAWSRIYLSYHTPKQVLVGCGAGAACACAWFGVVAMLRRSGWLDWALDTRVSRALRFRDLVLTEDVADAGWLRWEERRRRKRDAGVLKKT